MMMIRVKAKIENMNGREGRTEKIGFFFEMWRNEEFS